MWTNLAVVKCLRASVVAQFQIEPLPERLFSHSAAAQSIAIPSCFGFRLLRPFRNASDQLVQSRKQKLYDGRFVRPFVAEDQIDGRRISLERTTRYRAIEKVLHVSR
jgi:hypothetical protein